MTAIPAGFPVARPVGLRRAARDIAVLARRNLLYAVRQPGVLLVSSVTNAVRGLVLGPGALPLGWTVAGQVGLSMLWAAAISAVCIPVAMRAYGRTVA